MKPEWTYHDCEMGMGEEPESFYDMVVRALSPVWAAMEELQRLDDFEEWSNCSHE